VLDGYAEHALPLSHVNMDVDWHQFPGKNHGDPSRPVAGCDGYGGFVWNSVLFPEPIEWVNYLHSASNPLGHPLKLLLNLHLDRGIDHCQPSYNAIRAAVGNPGNGTSVLACDILNQSWTEAMFKYALGLPGQPTATQAGADYWWVDYSGCPNTCVAPNCKPGLNAQGETVHFCASLDQSNCTQSMIWNNLVFSRHQQTAGRRPLVLARFGGLGNHRAPLGFSGDSPAHWKTLQYQIGFTATAANVLQTWSHDLGGFYAFDDGNPANASGSELLLRWLQFGVVSPVFRTHCSGIYDGPHCYRRIWLFPHYEQMKSAMVMRDALLPYLLGANRVFHDTGVAVVHPCYYEYPLEADAYASANSQYLFGDSMLASPITSAAADPLNGTVSHTVWLPPGIWTTWGGERSFAGPVHHTTTYTHAETPLFVKGGAAIPMKASGAAASDLQWVIFPAGGGTGFGLAYDDEGDGYGYKQHEFATTLLEYTAQWAHGGVVSLSLKPVHECAGDGCFTWAGLSRSHTIELRGLAALGLRVEYAVCSSRSDTQKLRAADFVGMAELVSLPGQWVLGAEVHVRIGLVSQVLPLPVGLIEVTPSEPAGNVTTTQPFPRTKTDDAVNGSTMGLHAVSTGVRFTRPHDGFAINFETTDAGVVRWGLPAPFPTPMFTNGHTFNHGSGSGPIDWTEGASFMLCNNIYSTNYVMWWPWSKNDTLPYCAYDDVGCSQANALFGFRISFDIASTQPSPRSSVMWKTDDFTASSNTSRFPAFTWRARVIGGGAKTTNFGFIMNKHENYLTTASNGTEWSVVGNFEKGHVAVRLQEYPNMQLAAAHGAESSGLTDFPALVTFFGVLSQPLRAGVTQVVVEVTPTETPSEITTLSATLLHITGNTTYLGVMVGRDVVTGAPRIETMRSFNKRQYWQLTESLPRVKTPNTIIFADSINGDDDQGLWTDALEAMNRLGMASVDTGDYQPPDSVNSFWGGFPPNGALNNFTRPFFKNLTGLQHVSGGSCLQSQPNDPSPDVFRNSWAPNSVFALNASERATLISTMCSCFTDPHCADGQSSKHDQFNLLRDGYSKADISIGAMVDEPLAGSIGGGAGLPPVSHNAIVSQRWMAYLQSQGLNLAADFGKSLWSQVLPAGRPLNPGDGNASNLISRKQFYWTARFVAWDATATYAAATNISREAFSPEVLVYANLDNSGGRFFCPNTPLPGNWYVSSDSAVSFDWQEFGRMSGASLLWTEDW
jgi:hypothetical protein